MNTRSAFDFYQRILPRLPVPVTAQKNTATTRYADSLSAIAEHFDVFVFDAFGVLNVGDAPIEGAHACIESLRSLGKTLFVLTNGASQPLENIRTKFTALGYEFSNEEIISSRYCAEAALQQTTERWSADTLWGAICRSDTAPAHLPVDAVVLTDEPQTYDRVDAFVFLSSASWSEKRQALLLDSLAKNLRPVVVANPDVVAPLEGEFSLEPGYFSHRLLDELSLYVEFHGKPFPSVYQEVRNRLERDVDVNRIAMLGDTLHTDVIGANAQGWCSILVSDYGLFRGHDATEFIRASGIVPDWIVPRI